MVFHWSLSDSKSPQVSRTRLRILAVLSNAVVWIVSVCPPISKSSRPFNNPLVIVPNAPITIGTIVTFMFHSFFNSLARSRYLLLLLLLFLLLFYSLHAFHTSVSWLSFTGVSSNLQDSSQYSSQFQQSCNLDGHDSFYDFTTLPFSLPSLSGSLQAR